MTVHRASCRCGGLGATATGVPVRISICHCRDCQKRSGSAFSAQVRFADGDVSVTGAAQTWRTTGDSGRWAEFDRCRVCGDTVTYRIEALPGLTAIPLGAFDDPDFFVPAHSVWENRKHRWLAITGDMAHHQ